MVIPLYFILYPFLYGTFQKQSFYFVSHCSNCLIFCYSSLSAQFSQGIQCMGDRRRNIPETALIEVGTSFIDDFGLRISSGTSLVAQWLRIYLPMQGTRGRALVREDPTCRRVTKPMRHSYWACALEPASYNYWAHAPQLLQPTHLEPMLRNKRSHHNDKPAHLNKE